MKCPNCEVVLSAKKRARTVQVDRSPKKQVCNWKYVAGYVRGPDRNGEWKWFIREEEPAGLLSEGYYYDIHYSFGFDPDIGGCGVVESKEQAKAMVRKWFEGYRRINKRD